MTQNLSRGQKLPISRIYVLFGGRPRRFLGLLLASSCPHTHRGEVSSVIALRAQAYPQGQRPWVIGSSPLASHGHDRPQAPGFHHAPAARPGHPTDTADSHINFRPRKAKSRTGLLPPSVSMIATEIFSKFHSR